MQDRRKQSVAAGNDSREISMDVYRNVVVAGVGATKLSGVFYKVMFSPEAILSSNWHYVD